MVYLNKVESGEKMTESEANERPSEEDIFNSDYFKKWKEKIE